MQVLHGERSLYNARGGWDLARFLADPDKDDVEAHLANLRCAPRFDGVLEGLFPAPQSPARQHGCMSPRGARGR